MISHLTIQQAQALPANAQAFDEPADNRAVRRWLLIYQARSTHTARSYAQEARRWRLFLATRHGDRPDLLFQATEADVLAYRLALAGESSGFRPYLVEPRLLAHARFKVQPFTRALKPASVTQAVAILHALYEFLQRPDEGGLQMRENPLWRMKRAIRAPIVATKRVLTPTALEAMLETGALGGEDIFDRPRYRRALWITQLLLGQWLRRAEAANLVMSDFEQDIRGKWTVKVLRKGGKTQVLPVLESTMAGLRTYREALGLPPDPRAGETLPAVLPLEPKVGGKKLTGTTLYNEVKWLAERTRERLSGSAQCTAADLYSLGNCSPHWFRHSGVSRSLNAGAKLALVSRMAGHASVNTTTALYFHEDLDAMRDALS